MECFLEICHWQSTCHPHWGRPLVVLSYCIGTTPSFQSNCQSAMDWISVLSASMRNQKLGSSTLVHFLQHNHHHTTPKHWLKSPKSRLGNLPYNPFLHLQLCKPYNWGYNISNITKLQQLWQLRGTGPVKGTLGSISPPKLDQLFWRNQQHFVHVHT